MSPPSPTEDTPPAQLRLACDPAIPDPTVARAGAARRLLAIQGACRFLLDIANHRVPLDDNSIDALRDSLNTLDAAGPLPGRLGYLTRLLNRGSPPTYCDLVVEVAFAVHLNDSPTP
jgi:hypothetical protein